MRRIYYTRLLLQLLLLSLILRCNLLQQYQIVTVLPQLAIHPRQSCNASFHRAASNRTRTHEFVVWQNNYEDRPSFLIDAYLSLSPPSKFRLIVATPWPCLFFATALYSPASAFATLSILNLARWYSFWSSSKDVLNRPSSFTSSVPWYLRSPPTCQVEMRQISIYIANHGRAHQKCTSSFFLHVFINFTSSI